MTDQDVDEAEFALLENVNIAPKDRSKRKGLR